MSERPPLVPRPAALAAPAPPVREQLFFCLETYHPDPNGGRADQFDLKRIFAVGADHYGAPECPACEKTVSAVPVPTRATLPPSLVVLKKRYEANSR